MIMIKTILRKKTIYTNAISEGMWDPKYGNEGTTFPFYTYENTQNIILSFVFPNVVYEISREILQRFYNENPQIKIIKFNTARLIIPLSICKKKII